MTVSHSVVRRRLTATIMFALLPTVVSAQETRTIPGAAPAEETLLLQQPSIGPTRIVFSYARDLWVVPRSGGEARRLTTSSGGERWPQLSPDERYVAFSAEYDGNLDVYVMSIDGGVPRRLTWHPGSDIVRDWHPDGKHVLIASDRDVAVRAHRFFVVDLEGGTPKPLDIPRGLHARYSNDALRIAYTPYYDAFYTWKRYRGGRVTPIWIYDPATNEVDEVPHVRASDSYPAWTSKWLYFASDRDERMNLWRYDPASRRLEQITHATDFDVRDVDAFGDTVVFAKGGALHLHDATSGNTERLTIVCRDDGAQAVPRWESITDHVRSASIAPNGKRAVVEARGEILTVPREHGSIRNLTSSPGAHDRSPVWSPDGKHIAWFSDEGDEYRLVIRDHMGHEKKRFVDVRPPTDGHGESGGFYYSPSWSPDSKRVLYRDKTGRVCFVDVQSGEIRQVSHNEGSLGVPWAAAAWSKDSKWIAYERRNPRTLYDDIVLYSVDTGESTVVTDGFANADAPCFSADGRYLFFAASIDRGPSNFGLDMSAGAARVGSDHLYYVALRASTPELLPPKSDEGFVAKSPKESKAEESKPNESKKGENEPDDGKEGKDDGGKESRDESSDRVSVAGEPGVQEKSEQDPGAETKKDAKSEPLVELDGLAQRILALPIPAGNFAQIECAEKALLFLDFGEQRSGKLQSFDFDSRKVTTVESDVRGFDLSADKKNLLIFKGSGRVITNLAGKDAGALALAAAKVRVEPREEWREILREVWRIERDYFYDPAMHGVDWNAMWERWSPFVEHVRHRADLNLVIAEMIGELACGHEYVSGGEMPSAPAGVSVGLLGCDFDDDGEHYVIARILRGQNWVASLRSPLTVPGIDVREGDRLIAVNGVPITVKDNVFSFFVDTAGKQVELTVATPGEGDERRTVMVVPIPSEASLRHFSWIEDNRKRVDRLSGGRLAYIYMPNTGNEGMLSFDRDFYSQLDKEGLILDERYNGGGKVADYVIDVLSRRVRCYWMNREQWVGKTPFATMDGPKVMIVNEMAGSGGDAMPWMFQKAGLGPIVGNRTWGGLVGISGYPPLMDGGSITAASFGIMDENGDWVVENVGVTPDHTVIEYPKPIIEGGDPQLERAVELAMQALQNHEPRRLPEYHPPAKR
ncbi:MAG: PD40 domain-containing protein [Planctomycetes bacterium]|nr:PD40 domain-containing protein [Planctomycetota bacterium]MCB9917955.1 PD40 domain-containing protein [Planctomycetota bacterium]